MGEAVISWCEKCWAEDLFYFLIRLSVVIHMIGLTAVSSCRALKGGGSKWWLLWGKKLSEWFSKIVRYRLFGIWSCSWRNIFHLVNYICSCVFFWTLLFFNHRLSFPPCISLVIYEVATVFVELLHDWRPWCGWIFRNILEQLKPFLCHSNQVCGLLHGYIKHDTIEIQ